MTTPQHRFLIIADGDFGPLTSKTANSCIRYFPERIVAVFDRKQAGKTAQEVLGFGGTIPVVGDFERGLAQGKGATAVMIGIAPAGGRLPDEWKRWLRTAIEKKLEIWSGLHTFIGDDPELGPLAQARGVRILDARRPPPNLPIADGRAAEQLVLQGAKDNDIVLVEGQGSLIHPGYSGVTLGLLHGSCPDALILCHQATRDYIGDYHGREPWVKIPSYVEMIDIYERAAQPVHPTKVIGICLNTYDMDEVAARDAVAKAAEETGLPATDPVRFDSDVLVDAIIGARATI